MHFIRYSGPSLLVLLKYSVAGLDSRGSFAIIAGQLLLKVGDLYGTAGVCL